MDTLTGLILETWSALAQSLIFGIALTVCVRVALGVLVPCNASTRYAIWLATLIAIAILPPVFLLRTTSFAGLGTNEAAEAFQAEVFLPRDAAFDMLSVYALVVVLLFGRIGISYLHLRRLKQRKSPVPPEIAERFQRWLALCKTPRSVQLLMSTRAGSPLAAGFSRPAVVIPDSLPLQLTREELDHLGLHELAHVRRYDDWTNLIQRVIRAVFFFHPAVHWICRRLDFEREIACDDWVLTLTGAAKPYARSLAKILEHTPWQRGPILASGAVFRKRQIFRRIEMLLDGSRDSKPGISQVTFVVILMCLFGAFVQMVQTPALIAFGTDSAGSHSRSRWQVDGRMLEMDIRGDIQFGEDDISVQTLSPGGYLELRERGWTRRELEVRSGTSGQPEVRYLVDGKERPVDDKAREWIATILPMVIRENGFHAEERALRILRKRGASGVFEEIDRIASDHSRQSYLSAIIRSGALGTDDLRRAMNRAGRLSSDHDKANLLLEVAGTYSSDQLRGSYFDALNSIGSDHDRRRVLAHVIEESGKDSALLAQAGRSIERISSDHDKAELLKVAAARMGTFDPQVRRSLLSAATSINSDHDKANVIEAILAAGQLPSEALEDVLRVAATIQSDHDKANVLTKVVSETVTPGFIEAARSINSDHDKRRVLEALLKHASSADTAERAVALVTTIGSDHEKAELLSSMAEKYGDDPEVRAAVRKAAESIGSDSDYRRIVSKLLRD